MSDASSSPRRFDIALSFPGEHRGFVEEVAGHLATSFTQDRVLYDEYHDAEFARPDLDVYLPNLYRTQSELIVLFLCPEYAAKRWCGLECRFIRQLIGTPDAKRIMFLSFGRAGDYSEFGILTGDGVINVDGRSAKEIAEKVLKRLCINQGITPPKPPATIPADISRILKYAPAELIGREDELKTLNDAWAKTQNHETKRPRILTFVALGGEGKTSLVAKWAAELAAQDWPGCAAAFAWSFYSQGTCDQVAASSDLFLKEALIFFATNEEDKQFAASPADAFEKGQRLARIIGARRCLLILDGLEPLQYPTEAKAFKPGELKDQGIAKLLKDLASNSHGLCIVTTRIEVPDLNAFKGGAVIETHLKRLPRAAGVTLLKSLGVKGSERRNILLKEGDEKSEKVNEFEKLVEDVKGHALTLTLLGGFLSRAFHGDIRQRDRVKFEKADEKMDGGHAFRTMAAYEQWLLNDGGDEGRREVAVLRLMGLFGRPADAGCLAALRGATIPDLTEPLAGVAEEDWEFCLSGLETAKLLTVNRDVSGAPVSLDAHPHLREYFAKQLQEKHPIAWRAAHRLLYEHLCETAPVSTRVDPLKLMMRQFGMNTEDAGNQPTLEDLQPLYQAVAHGCHAGLQQQVRDEVYVERILRRDEAYSANKLGAHGSELGAVSCFFEEPWKRVSSAITKDRQAWLISVASITLRALGRLSEALEPMQAELGMRIQQEDWVNAAVSASNLSELKLSLGDVAGAVKEAKHSVNYADDSGDAFWKAGMRSTHADALNQQGLWSEAEKLLIEAEQMQSKDEPRSPLLYSLPGFRYCDLILVAPERAAWRRCAFIFPPSRCQNTPTAPEPPEGRTIIAELLGSCRTASKRAAQTLRRMEDEPRVPLLTLALDHLTLGRAALYAAILEFSDSQISTAISQIDAAVSGFRRAGQVQELPRGLLTRAWCACAVASFFTKATDHKDPQDQTLGLKRAQEDLDEAWEIAERGPMPLFLADIHLYRARLFYREAEYPWGSPQHDLAEARRLIFKHDYLRRKEELEDAEAAAVNWT